MYTPQMHERKRHPAEMIWVYSNNVRAELFQGHVFYPCTVIHVTEIDQRSLSFLLNPPASPTGASKKLSRGYKKILGRPKATRNKQLLNELLHGRGFSSCMYTLQDVIMTICIIRLQWKQTGYTPQPKLQQNSHWGWCYVASSLSVLLLKSSLYIYMYKLHRHIIATLKVTGS